MLIDKQIEEVKFFLEKYPTLLEGDSGGLTHKVDKWKRELFESAQALDCYYHRNFYRGRLGERHGEDILNKLGEILILLEFLEKR